MKRHILLLFLAFVVLGCSRPEATSAPEYDVLISNGEVYDARRELPGWDAPGYDASDWDRARPALVDYRTDEGMYHLQDVHCDLQTGAVTPHEGPGRPLNPEAVMQDELEGALTRP